MGFWEAIVLGVVQGIGEFLPISSSAHLIVASHFLNGVTIPLASEVALHMGTLGAVLIYFWRDWLSMLDNLVKFLTRKEADSNSLKLFGFLVLGSVPAAIFGGACKHWIENNLHHPLVTVLPLAVVGILLYLIDKGVQRKDDISSLNTRKVLFIGMMQALALIPGVSRSGATIIGGRLSGIDREGAARFSFLLGTPAMFGAALLEFSDIKLAIHEPNFAMAVAVSFVSGCLAIKFFLNFLRRYGFGVFAVYRVLLAASVLSVFAFST